MKLLTGKTRVAPLKPLTIPILELTSARILATLMDKIRTALEVQIRIEETRYWSDSKTALCWIENKGEWKQFVRNEGVGALLWKRKPCRSENEGPDSFKTGEK